MPRILAVALAALLSASSAHADDKKTPKRDFNVQLLQAMSLLEVNLDADAFGVWAKAALKRLDGALEKYDKHLLVQVTLRRTGAPTFEVFGSPALSPTERASLLALLKTDKPPSSRYSPFPFRFVSGTPKEELPARLMRFPKVEDPRRAIAKAFKASTIAQQVAALQAWARQEALPTLGALTRRVPARFKGVRAIGALLSKTDLSGPLDVSALAETNPDYWRALVEMNPGDHAILMLRPLLFVAQGKHGRAQQVVGLLSITARRGAPATAILGEFEWRIRLLQAAVDAEIGKGIKLHDAQRPAEAIACYEAILKAYPHSVRAHYEHFQSRYAQHKSDPKTPEPDWSIARKAVYDANPLYGSQAGAKTGVEAYQLVRRMESTRLFRSGDWKADLITYADIAEDLGEHASSAELYWLALLVTRKSELIEQFLYCLDQLGVKDLQKQFKGDHVATLKRIAIERKTRMEANKAFQSMKVRGN